MNPGLLDRTIIIERATETQDGFGATTKTWATWKIRRARKIEVSGREAESNSREIGIYRVKFRIRYTEGVTSKNRVCYEGQKYDIEYPAEIGRREYHDLNCILRNP